MPLIPLPTGTCYMLKEWSTCEPSRPGLFTPDGIQHAVEVVKSGERWSDGRTMMEGPLMQVTMLDGMRFYMPIDLLSFNALIAG